MMFTWTTHVVLIIWIMGIKIEFGKKAYVKTVSSMELHSILGWVFMQIQNDVTIFCNLILNNIWNINAKIPRLNIVVDSVYLPRLDRVVYIYPDMI